MLSLLIQIMYKARTKYDNSDQCAQLSGTPVDIHCVKSLAAILFILYLYSGVRQSALIFLFRLRFLLGELNHATW